MFWKTFDNMRNFKSPILTKDCFGEAWRTPNHQLDHVNGETPTLLRNCDLGNTESRIALKIRGPENTGSKVHLEICDPGNIGSQTIWRTCDAGMPDLKSL